jgi:uncharacterized protein YjiS (DUF1127 family)
MKTISMQTFSAFDRTTAAGVPAAISGALRAALRRMAEADRDFRARRAARHMPDHILRDIGLTRAELWDHLTERR